MQNLVYPLVLWMHNTVKLSSALIIDFQNYILIFKYSIISIYLLYYFFITACLNAVNFMLVMLIVSIGRIELK